MPLRRPIIRSAFATLALALFAPFLVAQTAPATAKAGPATQTKQVTSASPSNSDPMDLNTATPDQLKTLPGIGDVYAKRIVDGRPYTMKNQIVQRGIVPQNTYDKIKDNIVAHRAKK